jgi:hypothetical protein
MTYCKTCGDDTSEAELDFCGGMCSECFEAVKAEGFRWRVAVRLQHLDPGQLREVDELIDHLTGSRRQAAKFVGVPAVDWSGPGPEED